MARLTRDQAEYLGRVLGREPGKGDRKATKQYLAYDRRRGRVQAEVDKIEDGYPLREGLVADLAAAEAKADAGAFKGAYEDLEAVKGRARDASHNYFAGLPYEVLGEIDKAKADLIGFRLELAPALDDMRRLKVKVEGSDKVSDCRDLEAAMNLRAEMTPRLAFWNGEVGTCRTQAKVAAKMAEDLGVEAKLASFEQRVKVYSENRPKDVKADPATEATLTGKLEELRREVSSDPCIDEASVMAAFDAVRREVEGAIDATLVLGRLQPRDPEPALERFQDLDARDARRVGFARQQMRRAAYKDRGRNVLGSGGPPRAIARDGGAEQGEADDIDDLAAGNAIAADGSTVTVGGVVYGSREYLGRGGMGTIHRYTGETGETVVVKSANEEGRRQEMEKEIRAHRQAMAGPESDYILKMKGTAEDADGTLHMILEEAKGGDANSFFKSIQAAGDAGILSPEASAALTKRTMRQALLGVKALHERGLLHIDIKAENFLIAGDGVVKLADFGSARQPNAEGKVARNEVYTTDGYAPPDAEQKQGVDRRSEVFWLGSMLHGANSAIGAEGELERPERGMFSWQGEKFDTLRTGHNATGLDRLRDAMLDPDPAKRPTIDGALLSTYLDEAGNSFEEEDVQALSKAVLAYSAEVGREVRDIQGDVNRVLGALKRLEPVFVVDEPEASRRGKSEAYAAEKARVEPELEALRERLKVLTKTRSEDEIAALRAAGETSAEDLAAIERVQPLLRAIREAERALTISDTPAKDDAPNEGPSEDEDADSPEDDLDEETKANTARNVFREGATARALNEEIRRGQVDLKPARDRPRADL